jgi:protein-disulfide isomerase
MNMWKFNINKNNFPTKLFVTASLLSFFLVGGFLVFVSVSLSPDSRQNTKTSIEEGNLKSESSINKNLPEGDPLITKVPKLEDMLKGPILDGGDPALGSSEAEVTIVEFADYECEVCRNQKEALERLRKEYPDKIRFIWKDYPVSDQGSPSFKAARAARCADLRDKFWEYNNELYKSEVELNRESFLNIAEKMKIDTQEFKNCLDDKRVDGLIMDNIREANALSINGIPFIYVNDQEIMGKASYKELKRLIELELND